MNSSASYKRSNKILFRKMIEYLFPAMLTMAALSLDEFVDSMIVSRLLGSSAMAVVGLGSPVTMCIAAVYTLLGNGGATLYALCLGKRDSKTAGKAFWLSIITALIVGLLFILLGFAFFNPLASLLCRDAALMPVFRPYLRGLLLTAPFIITILTMMEFLPPSGAPKIATAINLIANAFNMLMDYVYIRVFNMGVEGAAYATLTGYLVGMLLVIYIVCRRRMNIPSARVHFRDFRIMAEAVSIGIPSAVSQLGFALKFAFCNAQAMLYGGTAGIIAYSLCNQTMSIVSIFLAALVGASMPLIAVLHGQRDFSGEAGLLKMTMRMNGLLSVICFIAFVLLARPLAALYSITGAKEVSLAVNAVRIFSIMYLLRGFCIIFMKYLQSAGRKAYSLFISMFDGFIGIIPIASLLGRFMGLDGLWWAFPVSGAVLLVIMLGWNRRIVRRSNGRYSGWLLQPREDEAEDIFDATIFGQSQSISTASAGLMDFCIRNSIETNSAHRAALAVEKMALYARNRLNRHDYMDVLARLYGDRIEIDFRALGGFFNPMEAVPEDIAENIRLLRGIANKLEYDYIMGMNCTRITIARTVAPVSRFQ